MLTIDLTNVFSLDPGGHGLEAFIARKLVEAGHWEIRGDSSDGISYLRILEQSPARLSVGGRMYHIDQTIHSFWLELERDPSGMSVSWHVYFDVVARSERRARDAIELVERPSEIEWLVTISGRQDGGEAW